MGNSLDTRTAGRGSPVDAATLARAEGKLRFRVNQQGQFELVGLNAETFMSPLQPMPPQVQAPFYGAVGRRWDYPVGINTNYTPRGNQAVSFADCRALAQNYDLLRTVIETRKDQMCALDWKLAYKDKERKRDAAIDKLEAVFVRPDQRLPFVTWMRSLLEEVFVTDALTIYPTFTNGGQFYGFEQLDGALIKPVIDASGRQPDPPQPAYQQILKGLPAVDYTLDELVYWPRNPRVNSLYGYSPVEQIIVTVNIALRRQIFQLDYYRQGSIPDAMIGVPDTWTPEQIVLIQEFWDAQFLNPSFDNVGERRKLKFMPGGKVTFAKDQILKDEYDEWLARIVCYAFSVSPQAFVKQMNRGTGETQKELSTEEGLIPLKKWWKALMDFLVQKYLKAEDVEFAWTEEEAVDQKTASDIACQEVDRGIVTVNEVRAERGLEPLDGDKADQPHLQTNEQVLDENGNPITPAAAPQGAASGAGGEPTKKPDGNPKEKSARALAKAAAATMGKRIDATKRVPYGFGISEDGATIYRDYRIPGELTVNGIVIPLDVTCGAHEVAEFQHVRKGAEYDAAHAAAQDEAEHPLVEAFGANPADYEAALAPFLAEALKVTDMPAPADLAIYPYEAEGALELLKVSRGTLAKAAPPRERQVQKIQRERLTRAVKRQLRAWANTVNAAVTPLLGNATAKDMLDAIDFAAMYKTFPPAVADPLKRASADAVRNSSKALQKDRSAVDVSITEGFVNDYAESYALTRGAEMVGMKWVDGELVENPDARWAITDETRAGIQSLLDRVISEGWTVDKFAAELSEAYAFSSSRAEMIARTETRLADSKGSVAGWKQSGVVAQKVWLISNDGCCDDCQGNADAGPIDLDDDFPSGDDSVPAHPNAVFAGSSYVSYGKTLEMISSAYDGPAVRVIANGVETTIGPNHPMLTTRGLVKAAELREGDQLFYDLRADDALRAGVEADLKEVPPIEHVFDALRTIRSYPSVSASGRDFHGDGEFCQGEVYVVVPDGELLNVADSCGLEQFRESHLMEANVQSLLESGLCSRDFGFDGIGLTAPSGVRKANCRFAVLTVSHVESVRFVGRAFDATTESSLYCSDGFVVSNCKCVISPVVGGDDEE